ncbi:MAG: outer membrane protein assembly factor BamD [Saprospiraceae bacterium]|nr:outer membrane protein assembly factor BamD [Saprospiraceae bacterium]
MKYTSVKYLFSMVLAALLISSCTTEFEKVRTSNDPQLILKKANAYFKDEDYVSAQTLYELAVQFFRGKEEAEDIFFNIAYTYYHTAEYITASHYFNNFSTTFYNSKKKEEADFMSAYSHYRLSPNFKLDQSYSQKSVEALQAFVTKYPDSKRIPECNKLIDEMRKKMERKAHQQGLLYYRLGQYQSAVRSFEILLKDYPGSAFEAEAKYLLIKSSFELAENSVEEKQEERFNETIAYCKKYMDKFKDRKISKEVKDIYEKSILNIKKIRA